MTIKPAAKASDTLPDINNFSFKLFNKDLNIKLETLQHIAYSILLIFIIIIISYGILKIGKKIITKFFDKQKQLSKVPITDKRADTLKTITISILKFGTYFISITIILSIFGVNVTSIVAVAGVGGVAIGFGAQSLVKDVISGFFILLEDYCSVGDVITVNNMIGTVLDIGIRTMKIKNYKGDIFLIPNGQINIVTNHSRSDKKSLIDINIANNENAEMVLSKLKEVCDKTYAANSDLFITKPEVIGITEFKEFYFVIQISIFTTNENILIAERKIRFECKKVFDDEGIKMSNILTPMDTSNPQ